MKFNGNYKLGKNVQLGRNVRIGDGSIIYDNVKIGDNSTICDQCVIGEPLNSYYSNPNYEQPVTTINANSLIRSFSIIYAGCNFGEGLSTGHRVTIRENTSAGINFAVGTLSDIQGNAEFGNYCRLHSNVHIAQACKIGNYVFLYPYVILTNDAKPPSYEISGSAIGDFTQIASNSIIHPDISIGKNCLIGAGSVVAKSVPDNKLVVGKPARILMNVEDIVDNEGASLYPWMQRFSRGLPWADIGYQEWLKEK